MEKYLEEIEKLNKADFYEFAGGEQAMKTKRLHTMQINVGYLCNLTCTHCHLEAGPKRVEMMSKEVMQAAVEAFKKHGFEVADITGGAPEMNPNTRWLIEALRPYAKKLLVRSNLVILDDPDYHSFLEFYRANKVELICSMPCYGQEGVEDQRGKGSYEPIIKMLKELNVLGYGRTPDLKLNLVYNPDTPSLPPVQAELEQSYRDSLASNHGIVFDNLYTIANSALGRFGKRLAAEGQLEDYMNLLVSTFNKETVEKLMCLFQISVGWDGKIYDCDGHQAVGLCVDEWDSIFDVVAAESLQSRVVKVAPHCFACTAGHGSSCGGSLS